MYLYFPDKARSYVRVGTVQVSKTRCALNFLWLNSMKTKFYPLGSRVIHPLIQREARFIVERNSIQIVRNTTWKLSVLS